MFVLIGWIIYLIRDHRKEVNFLNRMIRERDEEIALLKKERFDLNMRIFDLTSEPLVISK